MADTPTSSGDSSSRKIRLVGELVGKTNQLRDAMRGIEASSNAFANNLARAAKAFNIGGSGGTAGSSGSFFGVGGSSSVENSIPAPSSMSGGASGGVAPAGASASGFKDTMRGWMGRASEAANKQTKYGGSLANVGEAILENFGPMGKSFVQAGAGALMLAAPNLNDALQYQNIRTRQSFFGAPSSYNMANIAAGGLPTSPMDVAAASNMSIATGMMPSNPNYTSYMQSAAKVSALAPGVGISGGVSAMGALNQARSINMLRMVGINVRDIGSNNVSTIDDVVDQLWKVLGTATKGKKIEPADLAVSLMPGNALDSFLNQYFSGDEGLKYAVITALYQRARGGVKDLSLANLIKGGSIAGGVQSEAALNSALFKSQYNLSDLVAGGVTRANKVATGMINPISEGIGKNALGRGFLQLASFLDAFSGIGGGAGGLVLNGLLGASSGAGKMAGDVLGSLFSKKLGMAADFLPGLGSAVFSGGALYDLYNKGDAGAGAVGSGTAAPSAYNGSGVTINVHMSGTYADGHSAGTAIAHNLNRHAVRRSAMTA